MEVITLNNEAFFKTCEELISKIDFEPEVIVGILDGGGYVSNEFKNKNDFQKVQFNSVKLKRKSYLKNNFIVKVVLKLLPYKVTNRLRLMESKKVKKTISDLNLNDLSNCEINFKFINNSEEKIKNILIVDDAIDTGKTIFIIKNKLKKLLPDAKIKIAVISWTIETSIIKPDYYLFKNSLVRYPWSLDYKGKDFEKKSFSI
ncbi:phosphoribosyltransferase [Litoribaculum gwangyangense]|uniref:Phosphoribosyltransferase domain-containing protein n=1 Tax=Litoribaculum gwangyangense TaxID=1130722 RepID=A0ABP9CSG0_9FLAO